MFRPSKGNAVDAGFATMPLPALADGAGAGSDAVGVTGCDEITVVACPPVVQPAMVTTAVSAAAALI